MGGTGHGAASVQSVWPLLRQRPEHPPRPARLPVRCGSAGGDRAPRVVTEPRRGPGAPSRGAAGAERRGDWPRGAQRRDVRGRRAARPAPRPRSSLGFSTSEAATTAPARPLAPPVGVLDRRPRRVPYDRSPGFPGSGAQAAALPFSPARLCSRSVGLLHSGLGAAPRLSYRSASPSPGEVGPRPRPVPDAHTV